MDIVYPKLDPPYDDALRSCVAAALRDYDVLAIVASGTIIRGTPDKRSDLDLHVIHRGSFRERVQAWHCGIPVEMFVNPPDRIPAYFSGETEDRRPITAHMFATGFILCDTDNIAAKFVVDAKKVLDNPPPVPKAADRGAYGAATMFEDADDLAARDPDAAALILGKAIYDLAEARMSAEPGWRPRAKDLLKRLREVDPHCADLIAAINRQTDFKLKLETARELCTRVAGADGFFEWKSAREELS